jgi:hypothetical protein
MCAHEALVCVVRALTAAGVAPLDIEDIHGPSSSTPSKSKHATVQRMFGASSGAGSGPLRRQRVVVDEDADGQDAQTPARGASGAEGGIGGDGAGSDVIDSATRHPTVGAGDSAGAVGDDHAVAADAVAAVEPAAVPSMHEDLQGWLKARKASWRAARQLKKTERLKVRWCPHVHAVCCVNAIAGADFVLDSPCVVLSIK